MKRILTSVITACLLCVCCLSSASAAVLSEDDDMQLLVDLGIINEETKAVFNNPMRRIDFVNLFSSIENTKGASDWLEFRFTDVDSSNDSADALAWLCISGAVSEAERFNPEQNITREEAAKILVTTLGYGAEAVIEGGYPDGYIKTASRLRLFDGVQGAEFTAHNACRMFRNALDVKTAAVKQGFFEKGESDLTMLERYYEVYFSKGKMTKNTLTKLNPKLSDSKDTIAVDNNEYVCSSKYDDLIGRYVTVYYRIGAARENEVIGVYGSNRNNIARFKVDYDVSFSDFTYTVYENNRPKKYRIGRSIDVIYNDKVYTQYSEEELLPENGDVTLIDSDRDGNYETVLINAYEIYIAGNGTSDGMIYDRLGKSLIDLNENCEYVIKENGEDADLSKIVVDNLLEVRKSRGNGDVYIQIDINRETVSGELTAISGDDRFLTVNSVQYELSRELRRLIQENSRYLDDLKIGTNICLYLDRNGNAGYYTSDRNEKIFYTYLRKVFVDEDDEDRQVFFRIMLPNGTWTTAKAAKRVTINGEKQMRGNLVENVLQGMIKAPLVVQCKLNSAGEVSMLEIEKKFDLKYERLTYKRGSRTFDGMFSIANDCTVFIVPGVGFETDESMYEIRNAGYFQDGANYAVDVYAVNEALVADVAVIRGNGKNTDIPNTEVFMIVDSIYETLVDDEVCAGIKTTTPSGLYEGVTRDSNVEFIDRITGKYLPFSELKKGDLIRVLCDNTGKIINGERLIDYRKFRDNKKRGAYTMTGGYRDGLLLRGGFVYSAYQDIIAVTESADTELDDPAIMEKLVVYSAQRPAVLVYDMEEQTARAGNMNDIIPYKDCNSKDYASFVYIQSTLGDPKFMIIYK